MNKYRILLILLLFISIAHYAQTLDTNRIKFKVVDSTYSKGYFGGHFDKTTATITVNEKSVKKGKYTIRLENINSIKEMQGRKANIKFGRAYHGK